MITERTRVTEREHSGECPCGCGYAVSRVTWGLFGLQWRSLASTTWCAECAAILDTFGDQNLAQ